MGVLSEKGVVIGYWYEKGRLYIYIFHKGGAYPSLPPPLPPPLPSPPLPPLLSPPPKKYIISIYLFCCARERNTFDPNLDL